MQRDDAVAPRPSRLDARLIDAGVVAAFTALAAFTRYRPLAPHSLFLDDAWVAVGYRAHGLAALARTTFTSPLFSLATDGWLKAVGLTSLRAQLPAFVAGIVAPATTYALARSMRMSRAASLVAGALLLCAPFHLLYSSRVKQYTLDALLTCAILFVAWRALDRQTTRRVAGVTATAVVASLASIAVAPVAAGAFAALAIPALRRRAGRAAVTAGAASYVAIAGLWYGAVIRPSSHASLREYWQQAGGFWADDRLRLSTGFHDALSHVARGFSALPPTLTLALLGLAVIVACTRSIERAVLLVTPAATALALSAARVAPIGARVDVYLYPTFAILAAYAAEPLVRRSAWLVIAPVAFVALLLAITPLPRYYPQENIAPLVDRLEARAEPTDPIVLYRMGEWGFALYTRWPVRIVRDGTEPVPFTAQVQRPDIYEVSNDQPTALVDTIEDGHRVRHLWFIGAHGRRAAIARIDRTIEAGGFRMVSKVGDHGAWLDEFAPGRTPNRSTA
jgi:hypothetical protein